MSFSLKVRVLTVYFRSCKRVDYIPSIAVGISTSTQLKEALTHGKALQANLEDAKHNRLDNLELLSSEEEQLIRKVEECEERMIQKAREISQNTKEDIRNRHAVLKSELNEELKEVDACSTTLKECTTKIEKPTVNESQLFIDLSIKNKILKTGGNLVKTLSSNAKRKCLSYKFDEGIFDCLNKYRLFGNCPQPVNLTLAGANERKMNIKIRQDESRCDITCIVESVDGTFLLTDFTNKRLKRVCLFGTVQDWIDLPGCPMCVCYISESEVAVSLREQRKIQVVATGQPMKLTSCFSTPEKCARMCYDEGKDDLYVCCGGKWLSSTGQVHVYSRNGILKRSFGSDLFSSPIDIRLNKEKYVICVADREKGVFVLDTLGNVKLSVTNRHIYEIWSAFEITDDQLCVCGYRSNNVCIISKEGDILSKIEGIVHPYCIYLRSSNIQLIVCFPGDNLGIFELQDDKCV